MEVRLEIDAGSELGLVEVTLDSLTVLLLQRPLDPVAEAALDVGEAAVIHLAIEQDIQHVCIDDKKGRRMALAVGLRVVGTLGPLLRAKQLRIITAVKPYLDRLEEVGTWYDDDLIQRVLVAADE